MRWSLAWMLALAAIAVACGGPAPVLTEAPTASVTASPAHDGVIDKAGLRHDSRDTLYRTPGGAVPAGTPVMLRFRTLHDDVTGVTARVYSVNTSDDQQLPMDLVAAGVACYEADLAAQTCDYWQVTLPNAYPDNLWYRFVVEDRLFKMFYADDTPALDGGPGAPSGFVVDNSWALTVYEPDFVAPSWTSSAVVYQIFPDRFRNGDPANDPQTGDQRYDDPVLAKTWDDKPEGFCRGYADHVCGERPLGRDYFGGDLAGITSKLDYLVDLGVTVIYMNPIFDSASNHGYDTQDWTHIDPYFGTQEDWDNLVREAGARGIRIILDGVFNHVSSDSRFFDRYRHYDEVGGCESESSAYRDWFYFHTQRSGACTSADGANTTGYTGWSGFDSIPVLQKGIPAVRDYFLGDEGVVRGWLEAGASGWRLDVSGDPSFPDDWWPTFRQALKATDPDALTIAEQWQKDTTLLRQLRGDRFDTTMNYRFRDAVLGFLAPGAFDARGFPASGTTIRPIDFARRVLSQQEDYPPDVFRSLWNLIDTHDTERALWTLTAAEETTSGREDNAASLAQGKQRLRLAALIQFTMPGMPTIYYGDEVGLTGDDDPDDRRPYPWADLGGSPDADLLADYQALADLRATTPALTDGDLRFLYVGSDEEGTIVYARHTDDQVALVVINRSGEPRSFSVPVEGLLADGTLLTGGNRGVMVEAGVVKFDVVPLSGYVLVTGDGDFAAPAAPANLVVAGGGFDFDPSPDAASYRLYASPVSGGGYVLVDTTTEPPAGSRYFVMTALDEAGNESGYSNEVAIP